jgi:hypothetical protein
VDVPGEVGSVSVHGLPVAGGWMVTVLDAHATAPISTASMRPETSVRLKVEREEWDPEARAGAGGVGVSVC